MEDIIDISKNIQSELSNFASGPMSEIADLTKQVRDNFMEANSAANLEITGEDKLAKMDGQLTGIQTGYQVTNDTIRELQLNLNGITDKTELGLEAVSQQEKIQKRIELNKADEEKITNNIAEAQQLVLMAERRRETVPFNSDEYKEYTELIKNANANILKQQSHVFGLQAQSKGLKDIHDGYLATIIKEAESEKSLNEITATRRKLFLENTKTFKYNLDLIKQQNSEIERLGPGLDDYVKQWGALNDSVISSFESIKDGITNFTSSIPLVGNLITNSIKDPLNDAAKEAKEKWQGFTEAMMLDMSDANGQALSFSQAFKKNIGSLGSSFGDIGKKIMKTLFNPVTLVLGVVGSLVFLMKSAFDEISRLQDAGRDFRKELGLSANESERLRDNAESLEKQYYSMGLRVEDFYNAQSALADVFSSTDHITKQQTETIALMEKSLGISAETTAGAMNNMMKLGATGRGEAAQLTLQMKNLASKHGVAFSKVMEDIASAGEDALIFTRGSAKALAEGAVHARRLGSSMDDVASAAESLLDFESSISSEMEASTMFGRHINMNGLRAAAMAGDTNAMLQQRMKIMDDLGGLENMSRWQQKALAEAMGTSVEELMNMNKTREQEQMLQNAAARNEEWAIKALARRNKALEKNNKSAEEQLRILEEENQRTETMEALTNKLQGAWHKVVVALAPFAEKVMEALVEVMQEFTGSADQAKKAADNLDLEGLKSVVSGVANTVKYMGEILVWALSNPIEALAKLAVGFLLLKATMAAISGLSTGIFDKIRDKISGVGDAVKTTTPRRGGILDSVKRFINGLKPANVLAVATSLAILSGAIWVTAKAFQEFSKVSWDGVAKGLIAIGSLVGAATLLNKASKQMLTGAFAIAILGASLIPAAYAFNLFGDVSWSDVIAGGIALGVLGAAIFGLGAILSGGGAILFGAGVIGLTALGAALIPLAFAINLAGPALVGLGNIFENVASIIGNTIVNIVEGIGSVVKIIGEVLVNTIGAASIGFDMFAESLIKLSSIGIGGLLGVAGGITAIAGAMASFGVGSAVGGIGNAIGAVGNSIAGFFGGDTRDPIEKLIDSFERLSGINPESLKTISNFNFDFLQSIPEDVDDKLSGLSNELPEFFKALSTIDTSVALNMSKVGPGLTTMLKGLSVSLPKIKSTDTRTLAKLADGMSDFFESLDDMDTNLVKEMPNINVALGGIAVSLSDIDVIPGNVDEILERVGEGIHDFFYELEGFETEPLDQLGTIKQRLSPFIVDFASLPLANIPSNVGDILNDVGYGVHEFFDELAGFKEDALVKLPGISVSLVPFIDSISKVKLPSEDIDSVLKSMGNGLEEFADYIDDGEGASINKFFKQTGTQFVDFVKNLSVITNVGDISVVDKVKELSLLSGTFTKEASDRFRDFAYTFVESVDILSQVKDSPLDTLGAVNVDKVKEISSLYSAVDGDKVKELFSMFEAFSSASADKLTEFSYMFADSMSTIAEIKDPVVDSLNAINTELYKLCETISKLDTQKLQQLKNIPSISQTSEVNTKTFAERMQSFKNMVYGENVTNQLNQNTTDNLIKSTNTSVGIQSNTKLSNVEKIQQFLNKEFMSNVGGDDKFIRYMDSKKAKEIADKALRTFRAENESYKITKQSEDEFGMLEDVTVGYKGEDKNQKYQELVSRSNELSKAMQDNKRGLKNEYIRNTALSDSSFAQNEAGRRFNTALIVQENKIPMHYEKSVSGNMVKETIGGNAIIGNKYKEMVNQRNQQFISDMGGEDKFLQYQNTMKSGDVDATARMRRDLEKTFIRNKLYLDEKDSLGTTAAYKQSMLFDIKMKQLEANLQTSSQQQNQNQLESTTTNRLISATTPVTDSGSLYTNNRMQEKFEFESTNRISDIEASKSDLGQIDSIHVQPQNIFIEEIAKVGKTSGDSQTQTKVDNKEVVSKLDELIVLMRRGGISVNMDGKKVSKAVASAHDF